MHLGYDIWGTLFVDWVDWVVKLHEGIPKPCLGGNCKVVLV